MDFEGRIAVVTGASKGIGAAIARRLASRGAAVVVNARDEQVLDAVVSSIEAAGGTAVGFAGNITRPGVCEALVTAAVSRFGRIDHLVNCVGVNTAYGPLMQVDRDGFLKTMERNTWPSVELIQHAVRQGLGASADARPRASVVLISTIGSHTIAPNLAAYCASKGALDILTRHLARELGPGGVRVNAVAPGLIRTDMSISLWHGEKEAAERSLLPLGRLGRPEDIAEAAAWLLSEDSSWMTGQIVDVDGGRLLVGDEPYDLFGSDLSALPPEPVGAPAGSAPTPRSDDARRHHDRTR